ncbi:MAG: hypothetical protein KJN84_02805, partial [Bacteroidia bacterium]|nr:hypothetical protein [Bacteroidia bacterium]
MNIFLILRFFFFVALLILTSCGSKEKPVISEKKTIASQETEVEQDPQIAEYIRNIFQDKNGNFWFGTNGYGVAHYNGDSIVYYSVDQGFEGQQVTGIAQDSKHNLWFATNLGVVRYDWSKN